ncbi:MAG: hypothetical protein MJ056_01325 [Akkermansia sp.]|nr:hypothetical protein [Akkermansia sp.]
MAILLQVDNPQTFLSTIYADINNASIDTWKYDNEGDFTHSAKQWFKKAWHRPEPINPRLHNIYNMCFKYVLFDGDAYDHEIYGIYHGRFAEMLIRHYPNDVKALRLTPLPLPGRDVV